MPCTVGHLALSSTRKVEKRNFLYTRTAGHSSFCPYLAFLFIRVVSCLMNLLWLLLCQLQPQKI